MVLLPDLLRRFRGHAVPGAPVIVAVPVDPRGRAEAELGPVFDAIDAAQHTAAGILATAQTEGARIREDSMERVRAQAADAQQQAAAARAAAAHAVLTRGGLDRRRAEQAARVEAERIARVGRERMPHLVEEIVRRALLVAGPDSAALDASAGDARGWRSAGTPAR